MSEILKTQKMQKTKWKAYILKAISRRPFEKAKISLFQARFAARFAAKESLDPAESKGCRIMVHVNMTSLELSQKNKA